MSSRLVPFHTLDRQWDCRVNVPTEDDLMNVLNAIKSEATNGKFKYILVGGVEIGDQPFRDDYLIRHVHIAAIFNNRVSKASILKNWNIKQGLGYYLVPRNRALPYKGWREHHIKTKSKINENYILFEEGILPEDQMELNTVQPQRSTEEKKRKLDDIIMEMKTLIEDNKEQEAFTKFPRNYLTYGEKIKSMIVQKRDFFQSNGDPHIWLYGGPGTGKSAILQIIYPKYYDKKLDSKFMDLYDPKHHTHVLLQDLDHDSVEKLGVQFLKTLCDEAGFPIDQKYKSCQLARTTVLVSSNFQLPEVLPEDMKGRHENLKALLRRFWHVHIRDLLPIIGIKLLSKYEINQLKKAGNMDPRKCFLSWDYLRDCPTGEPLKEPEHYQQLIRDKYYGK